MSGDGNAFAGLRRSKQRIYVTAVYANGVFLISLQCQVLNMALLNGIFCRLLDLPSWTLPGRRLILFPVCNLHIIVGCLLASVAYPLQPLDGSAPISHFLCANSERICFTLRCKLGETGRKQDGVPALMHVLSLGVTLGLRRGQRSSG